MKKRVRLNRKLAALTAVILLAGGGTASAFYFSTPDEKPVVHKQATIAQEKTTQTEPTTTQPVEEATAAPVEQQPTQPTPEENKAKIKQLVDDYSKSKGFTANYVYAQSFCMDRAIQKTIGYSDYDALFDRSKFSPLNDLLYGFQKDGKLTKLYFDPGTCRVNYVPAENLDR